MNKRNIIVIIILLLSASEFTICQIKGLSSFESIQTLQESVQNKAQNELLLNKEQMPIGNSVEDKYYFIGPDDIISIQLLPSMPIEQLITISPENLIMIPRIGIIDLKGKTLLQAKDTILKVLKDRNPNIEAAIALKQSRVVLVTVKGNVTMPGTYYLPASYKVSTVIKMVNQLKASNQYTPQQQIPTIMKLLDKEIQTERLYYESGIAPLSSFSLRNISVFHSDGTTESVDIEKSNLLKNVSFDPYIREGDEVYVPFEKINYPVISIAGAVKRPTAIVYKNGDKASLLLKMGYGITENADLGNVKLLNTDKNDGNSDMILKVDSSLNLLSEDFDLKPGSTIIVGEKAPVTQTKHTMVSIKGNVAKPGIYLVEPNKSRLMDVIDVAGGLTKEAYLPLAYIVRRDKNVAFSNNFRQEVLENFQYSDLKLEDTTRYKVDVDLKLPMVSCDFVKAYQNKSSQDNVILEDGDLIYIPSSPGQVRVLGQVNQPGFVEFSENKNIEWYVEHAGGFGPGAEKSKTRIIRGRTKVWIEDDIVYAGDWIYVPRPTDISTSVQAQNYSVIAGVISATATLLSLIVVIFRK
jgi:protein involved in polysaccharide export with SLBB domain